MSTDVDTEPLVSVWDLIVRPDDERPVIEEGGHSTTLFISDIAGPYDWFKDGVCEAPTTLGSCARPARHSPDWVLFVL